MSQDIALPTPVAANTATGRPPGARQPTPAGFAPALAARLARPTPQPSRPPSPGPAKEPQARTGRSGRPSQDDTSGDESADTDPASSSSLVLVSVQALPPDAVVQAAALVLSSPPVPVSSQSEAMDTSPAIAPALTGSADMPSGGELLPQTAQLQSAQAQSVPVAAPVPAPLTVPYGAPVPAPAGTADGRMLQATTNDPKAKSAVPNAPSADTVLLPSVPSALSGTVTPLPATSDVAAVPDPIGRPQPAHLPSTPLPAAAPAVSTALAAQGYAQMTPSPLQNAARPANNTSKAAQALAPQGADALSPAEAADARSQQLLIMPSPTAGPKGAADKGRSEMSEAKDDASQAKPDGFSDALHGEMLMPAAATSADALAAKPSPAAPLPAEARAALMQQASGGLQTLHAQALKSGHGQMTLQLHPQDWGKLQVSVTTTPNASASGGTTVSAHLVADSAAVKQALEAHTSDLRRTLREAGLHLDSLTVSVRPASSSSAAAGGGFSGQNGARDTYREAAPDGQTPRGMMPGNGGTTFGGGSTHREAQNSSFPTAAATLTPMDTADEPAPRAVLKPVTPGRVDTRA